MNTNTASEVKVQVVCVTYNQKDYIKEALDSFLMQKTNFKFEVLVGDDCSTDGTSEIVAEYARKYPDIIKHIRRNPNMGCLANFMDLCENVTAPYVAFCDGDDYWTNENKLQKQFDFMEKNKDVNICAHKTYILANKSWNLYNYYSKQEEPLTIPDRKKTPVDRFIKIEHIMKQWPHTSSLLVRNIIKKYPNWAKSGGPGGDMSVIFLNLGDKSMYIIDEYMSVYRRVEQGVVYNNQDITEHFLNTRVNDYFRILGGSINYFKVHYNSFGIGALESRLWTEIINYTNAIIKSGKWEKLIELKESYPSEYDKVISLLGEYKYRLQQIDKLGLKQANLLRRNSTLKIIKPILKSIYRCKKICKQIKSLIKIVHSFFAYWIFALVPKKKNLWVFSGFNKKNYMDNTKYLFEYIVKNHPEIEAVWVSKDKSVRKLLKENKMPVLNMTSLKGIWATAGAEIAFSDHFKMTDYDNRYGFNARTKFVQLWHGVGPKSSIPKGDFLTNTTVKGARLSSDILIGDTDNILIKLIKILKYPFIAPFRELFEQYYMMCCPGQIFIDTFAAPIKTNEKARFLVGNPRNILTYNNTSNDDKFRILYAPTYRWNMEDEQFMVNNFIKNLPKLNEFLSKHNGELYLRLHPHTWRNYTNKINDAILQYDNIFKDNSKDIYAELYKYSVLITDYSSIAQDFLITKQPVIYFAFDIDTIESTDQPFNKPYNEYLAGELTKDWSENICALEKLANGVDEYKERRMSVLESLLPSEYNNVNNSKRIVEELKKRLNFGGMDD